MSYFQKDSPGKDKKANWLPSPDGDFGLSPCTARIISKIETPFATMATIYPFCT
jgi:hypothetical protein